MTEQRPEYPACNPRSAGDTVLLTSEHASMLLNCDRVHTHNECGWFCVLGFQRSGTGERMVVAAHTHTADDYRSMMMRSAERWAQRQA